MSKEMRRIELDRPRMRLESTRPEPGAHNEEEQTYGQE